MLGKGDVYTIKEVAQLLKVNQRTVYRWIDSGELRVARFGRKTYRVFEYDLKKFIRKHMQRR